MRAKEGPTSFIVFDDLNDWVGPLQGHPQAHTPAIDSIAQRGVNSINAHVQAPLCNPSRASFLTGLRPSTTGIYGLAPGIRAVPALAERFTLPQHFAAHGYATAAFGKIFHDGSILPAQRPREFGVWGPSPPMSLPEQRLAPPTGATGQVARLVDWASSRSATRTRPTTRLPTRGEPLIGPGRGQLGHRAQVAPGGRPLRRTATA